MSATYFLQRVLPFVLALTSGVAVWSLANPSAQVFGDLNYLERGGSRWGGRGRHRAKRCRHHRRAYAGTFTPQEVTTQATLLSKPEPGYTEEARRRGVAGVVKLRVVLGADGGVSHIDVLESLPEGLTERAMEAAERMRFVPAQRDGRPVSQWATVEYVFTIY